jgi:small subunit ribosomal protein S6
MTRLYELGFIVEPRQSDDEVQAITDKYTAMITGSGAEIKHVDNWGKRKLAYPIRNGIPILLEDEARKLD